MEGGVTHQLEIVLLVDGKDERSELFRLDGHVALLERFGQHVAQRHGL
jgi:hypothetical protein